MKASKPLTILGVLLVAQYCAQTYNVVRVRNDKYLQTTKYSLATEHELEGPGNYFTNYGKGARKLRVDYGKESNNQKVISDEIILSVQLFDDDPQLDNKLVILVDDAPIQLSDIKWQTGSKNESGTTTSTQYGSYSNQYGQTQSGPHQVTSGYSFAYKTARYVFSPSDQMKTQLKDARSMGVRIYLGAQVATAKYDSASLSAVRKFYSGKADEELRD